MIIKTASFKLNRTLLCKEGTKATYLTNAQLCNFFDDELFDLMVNNTSKVFQVYFYEKHDLSKKKQPIPISIGIKANSEIRLNSPEYSQYLERNQILEGDTIILYRYISNDINEYYIDFKKSQIATIQSYEKKQQDVFSDDIHSQNLFWFWDNHIENRVKEVIRNPQKNVYIDNKLVSLNFKYIKTILRWTNAQTKYQRKGLFQVVYENGDDILDKFPSVKLWDIKIFNNKIYLEKHIASDFSLSEEEI